MKWDRNLYKSPSQKKIIWAKNFWFKVSIYVLRSDKVPSLDNKTTTRLKVHPNFSLSTVLNFAHQQKLSSNGSRKLLNSSLSQMCLYASSYLSLFPPRTKTSWGNRKFIKKKRNIMCLSKSTIQMFNELTLMHAFLFAFNFFGEALAFSNWIRWSPDNTFEELA